MTERAFHEKIDQLFLAIELWWERSDAQLDFESQEGVLTLFLPQGGPMVLSRQPSQKEIWLAAASGAYHFQQTDQGWVTPKGEALVTLITQIAEQAGVALKGRP